MEPLPTGLISSSKFFAVGLDDSDIPAHEKPSTGFDETSIDESITANKEPTNSHVQGLPADFRSIFSSTPYGFTYQEPRSAS
jgi:hypothetical protein